MSPGKWQGIHIYYSGNRRPMLTECVRPLVDGLRDDGLLAGYFFVNDRIGGPHVRLRLRPSTPTATGEVCRRAEAAIGRYPRKRPALCEVNSFKYVPYEPEYDKYGGGPGVALAEWHFEHSSDLVIEATRTVNPHLRRQVLGVAAQLMMIMTTVFLGDEETTAEFLRRYADDWQDTFDGITVMDTIASYDKAYEAMNGALTRRFLELRTGCREPSTGGLPGLLGTWFEHCVELRDRAARLAHEGSLTLRDRDGRHALVTDVTEALGKVLAPYLHTTNNRLGITLDDEAYLGRALGRALSEREPVVAAR